MGAEAEPPMLAREAVETMKMRRKNFSVRSRECVQLKSKIFPLSGSISSAMKDTEKLRILDILRDNTYPPVRITASMEQMLSSALNQNFIPVVDDLGKFIGIVTRKDILRHLSRNTDFLTAPQLQKIV